MTHTKLNSSQETAIEALMDKSFGSPFLFLPKKYKSGKQEKEPVDLVWIKDGLVTLFYLRSSKEILPKQIKHNLIQANRYVGLWKRQEDRYTLHGVNRFGGNCEQKYHDDLKVLVVSVVSSPCGINIVHDLSEYKHLSGCIVVNIPEQLIYMIASFGGTATDLLQIIKCFTQNTTSLPLTNEAAFNIMQLTVHAYVQNSINTAHSILKKLLPQDPDLIHKISAGVNPLETMHDIIPRLSKPSNIYELEKIRIIINNMKIPSKLKNAISDTSSLPKLASIFADLTIQDYYGLSILVDAVLKMSGAPHFDKWYVIGYTSYHSFVVASLNLNAPQHKDAMTAAIQTIEKLNASGIFYGNIMDCNDYHYPLCQTLPKTHLKPLANTLFDCISEKITS